MKKSIALCLGAMMLTTIGCRSTKPGSESNLGKDQNSLTNVEVVAGLKEALTVGARNSVAQAGAENGFQNNDSIRLPFPPEVIEVKNKAVEWGFESQVEKFETKLNGVAEKASVKALPIFEKAISEMTIADGFEILNGGDGAATAYLRKNTEAKLIEALYPVVDSTISAMEVTRFWGPMIKKYNTMTSLKGGTKLDPDLTMYVTKLVVSGLFKLVEKEENKIRHSPAARTTVLLSRVFGASKT